MNCYPELTLAMYLDGGLAGSLALSVGDHLDSCAACRSTLASLRQENETFAEVMQAGIAEVEAPWALSERRRCGWITVAAMAGLGLLFGIPLNSLFGESLPVLDWMNSFSGAAFRAVSYLLAVIPSLSPAVAGVGILVLAVTLLRRRGLAIHRLIASLGLVAAFVAPGYAVTVRRNPQFVRLATNETVDETLIALSQEVRIDGTVNGDLVALGTILTIGGTVKGDLVAAGSITEITGDVEGNVLACGSQVELSGHVRGNVYAAGSDLRWRRGAVVEGEVIGAGANVNVEGDVKRSALLGGGAMAISGSVGRDLIVHGGRVTLFAPTRVGGKATFWVPNRSHVTVESGAVAAGGVDTRQTESHKTRRNPLLTISFYFGLFRELLAALIVGCFLLLVARGFFTSAATHARALGRSFGLGFVVLAVTPIALIVVAITWVGLPLALIGLGGYLAALYVAKIVAAAFLGQVFRAEPLTRTRDWIVVMLLGLLALTLAFHIPYYVGFSLRVAVLCFGLGALAWQCYRSARPVVTGGE
jgi:cytoskeletal protein CcmA (bactofilin family)